MTSPNTGIDSSESLSAGILRLEPRVVISEYEAETGKRLDDDVKSSVWFLVKGINSLGASITVDGIQLLQVFLTSNTIYGREITQPIVEALKKFSTISNPTSTNRVVTTVQGLLDDPMRYPIV